MKQISIAILSLLMGISSFLYPYKIPRGDILGQPITVAMDLFPIGLATFSPFFTVAILSFVPNYLSPDSTLVRVGLGIYAALIFLLASASWVVATFKGVIFGMNASQTLSFTGFAIWVGLVVAVGVVAALGLAIFPAKFASALR